MPESVPTTIEASYVANTVGKSGWVFDRPALGIVHWLVIFLEKGPAIAKGLADIILRKPSDPVEYLAHFLYKYAENKNYEQKVCWNLDDRL